VLCAAALFLAGCKGVPTESEESARWDAQVVGGKFRPVASEKTLPTLTTNSHLSDFLEYAMLNQPSVEAAYFDWLGSVERITVERSLPDPKLTFQAYITDTLTSLMPGLMQEFPWPGKLKAVGDVAAAEAAGKYFAFEGAALATAFSLKQSYYQLWFLEDKIRINREMLGLLAELEKSARARNETSKATLQDVYRAQIEEDRLGTELANLEDSRQPLLAQFKGALGLSRKQADPPRPGRFESTPLSLEGDELLETAFARNPRLKAMEADVRMAEASIALARKAKLPDFSVGLQAEVYTPPFFWPQGSMTLPIWRDKITAQIAAAQARKDSASARLNAEQIQVTVDFAMKTYDYREATRNLALLQDKLIPKARKSMEIARAGYLSGDTDFLNLMEASRMLLGFQLEEVQARTRREIVLADLSLTVAGIAPEGAPFLSTDSK
jgi:outer membrane protein TolC